MSCASSSNLLVYWGGIYLRHTVNLETIYLIHWTSSNLVTNAHKRASVLIGKDQHTRENPLERILKCLHNVSMLLFQFMLHYLMQDDKFEYSLTLAPFRPQRSNTYKYEVQVSYCCCVSFHTDENLSIHSYMLDRSTNITI